MTIPEDTMRAMLAELDKPESALHDGRFVGMFYGNSGTGKTVFAAKLAMAITLPDKKIVHIDTSEGFVSILNHPDVYDKNRFERVNYQALSQITVLAEAIRKGYGRFANVGCVIWDELSTSANDTLQLVAIGRETRLAKANKENTLAPGQNDQADYNYASNLVIRPWRELFKIQGLHIITIAHERDDGGEGEIKQIGPDFWKDMRKKINAPQKVVGRFTGKVVAGQFARDIQLHPASNVNTKSRIGGFNVKNDPDFVVHHIAEWLRSGATEEDIHHVIQAKEQIEETFTGIKVT